MSIVLKILCTVNIVIVVICLWKTAEYFNTILEGNKWRPLIAWDALLLFAFLVALMIKILTL